MQLLNVKLWKKTSQLCWNKKYYTQSSIYSTVCMCVCLHEKKSIQFWKSLLYIYFLTWIHTVHYCPSMFHGLCLSWLCHRGYVTIPVVQCRLDLFQNFSHQTYMIRCKQDVWNQILAIGKQNHPWMCWFRARVLFVTHLQKFVQSQTVVWWYSNLACIFVITKILCQKKQKSRLRAPHLHRQACLLKLVEVLLSTPKKWYPMISPDILTIWQSILFVYESGVLNQVTL